MKIKTKVVSSNWKSLRKTLAPPVSKKTAERPVVVAIDSTLSGKERDLAILDMVMDQHSNALESDSEDEKNEKIVTKKAAIGKPNVKKV